jgi:transcriptional antiterminator NusG
MWYVIHTITGKEWECLQQCKDYVDKEYYQNIFIPQYILHRHFKKEWHEIKKVLFPGYLFIDTEQIEPVVTGLKKIFQYARVLRDGELISPITLEEKEFLGAMMDEEYVVRYSEGFLIGEKVCITSGPLKKYRGNIKSVDRHRRLAKLEIPIFGRATPVEVGFGAIARVSEEDFHHMVEENIKKHQKEKTIPLGQVKVVKGIFEGMMGKFLGGDPERDEWTAELELFGVGTKVIFRRDEIQM